MERLSIILFDFSDDPYHLDPGIFFEGSLNSA